MSWNKIKIDAADRMFSNYIRLKADWKCENCGKLCLVNGEWVARLEASHYWSRSHEGTRFDEENVHSLCNTCHRGMGGHTRTETGEYDVWMMKKLGKKKFEMLRVRANTYYKKDRALALLWSTALYNGLKN